jgi:hypothetical protein
MTLLTRRKLERVVELTHEGRKFTFRVDRDSSLVFWRVESEGRIYRSPMLVQSDETPALFRSLADVASREWDREGPPVGGDPVSRGSRGRTP